MNQPTTTSRSPDEAAVPAARVHRWLAAHRRVAEPDVLYRLYLVALVTVPLTYAAWQGPDPGTSPDAMLPAVASWAPVGLALALVAAARYAAWAGVAVPERGAVAWLLTAPIERADLLGRPLRRAVLTWTGAGALAAHLLSLELVARTGRAPAELAVAAIGGGAASGAVAVSICWWIQADRRTARWTLRASPWLGALAVAAGAVAEVSTAARTGLLLSGPWGWAVAPVVTAAGRPVPAVGVARVALAVVALALVARTLARVDAVPTSELARRADPLSGVRAATYAGDLRFAAELRRRAHRDLVGPSRRRLPRPRHPRLAIPWLGATLLLRSPRWAISGAIAGVVLATLVRADVVARTPQPSALVAVAGAIACAIVVGQALDPLRVEETTGFAWRHLPPSPLASTLLHLVAPTVAAVTGILLALVTAVLAGASAASSAAAAAGAVLALVVLVPATAASITAPPPDPTALTGGPGTGLAIGRRALGWPLGLLVVVLLAGGSAVGIDAGAGVRATLLGNAVPALIVGGAFTAGLVRRLAARDADGQ